jgi:hypothetical protein
MLIVRFYRDQRAYSIVLYATVFRTTFLKRRVLGWKETLRRVRFLRWLKI